MAAAVESLDENAAAWAVLSPFGLKKSEDLVFGGCVLSSAAVVAMGQLVVILASDSLVHGLALDAVLAMASFALESLDTRVDLHPITAVRRLAVISIWRSSFS